MTKRTKIILAVIAVLIIIAVAGSYYISNRPVEPEVTLPPTENPVEATPTEKIEEITNTPTAEPTQEPVVEVTNTPEPTATPTKEPEATLTPEPTVAAPPTPSPMPTATSTPTPTVTPTPAEGMVQIGEYAIPEKFIASWSGEELSWFGENDEIIRAEKIGEDLYFVLVDMEREDGSRIHDARLLNVEVGTYADARATDNIFKNIDIYTAPVSDIVGAWTKRMPGVVEMLTEWGATAEAIPTPTPTPTPFPTPNPAQPKMLASYKGDAKYGDVTVEKWDNGYVYVNGTGVVSTFGVNSMAYCAPDVREYIRISNLANAKTTHCVVGEGIEGLDDLPSISQAITLYLELPSSLTGIDRSLDRKFDNDLTVVGYKDGQKLTKVLKAGESLYEFLLKEFSITSEKY